MSGTNNVQGRSLRIPPLLILVKFLFTITATISVHCVGPAALLVDDEVRNQYESEIVSFVTVWATAHGNSSNSGLTLMFLRKFSQCITISSGLTMGTVS